MNRSRTTHALLTLLLAVTAASVAASVAAPVAQAQGLPMGWSWASDGHGGLTVTVDAFDIVDDLTLTVTRQSDRRVFRFERAQMGVDESWTVDLPMPDRTTDMRVQVAGKFAGIPGVLEDVFSVQVLAEMDFAVDESSFDAEGHRFLMTMTQPAGSVELTVRSDRGELLAQRTVRFQGEAPGIPLEITWAQADATVLTVDVRAISESGAWASRTYIPWKVEFDAAHVNFASGSAEIPADDQPMLRARLAEIRETDERVREWVEVKLYVGGYTDTVGSAADNQRLSEARARAIASFFVAEGVSFPVYYQGFGESALAVQTADDTDEPANRRAVFIMSTQTPPYDATTPRGDWHLLNR